MQKFTKHSEANSNGYFSRRNQTNEAHLKEQRQREDRKIEKLASAAKRQEYSDSLTPAQRLAALDARLGKGVGAVKERARLAMIAKMK